ncbi:hypothetical protein D5086_005663 [Populus alba]|uniref:Uncharacterized protein n=1 Tax=Populus alba TaxID=43335 RepID=A0ACC4CTV6_POPAL
MSAHPEVPDEPTTTGTALLETVVVATQGFDPVNKIHQHLCAAANREAIGQVQISNCCGEANQCAVDSLANTR